MCDISVIICLYFGTRTHILISFFTFKFLAELREEAQLGLVLVTRGLFSSGLSFISFQLFRFIKAICPNLIHYIKFKITQLVT